MFGVVPAYQAARHHEPLPLALLEFVRIELRTHMARYLVCSDPVSELSLASLQPTADILCLLNDNAKISNNMQMSSRLSGDEGKVQEYRQVREDPAAGWPQAARATMHMREQRFFFPRPTQA